MSTGEEGDLVAGQVGDGGVGDAGGVDAGGAPSVVRITAGRHNFRSVRVPAGVVLRVDGDGVLDLRATGDVIIEGTLDLSGGNGGANQTGAATAPNGWGWTVAPGVPGSAGSSTACSVAGTGGAGAAGSDGLMASGFGCGGGGRFGGGAGAPGRSAAAGAAASRAAAAAAGDSAGGNGGNTVMPGAAPVGNNQAAAGRRAIGRPGLRGGPRTERRSGTPRRGRRLHRARGRRPPRRVDLPTGVGRWRGRLRAGSSCAGGSAGGGGGGGGGALRIASATRIVVGLTGRALANGGIGGAPRTSSAPTRAAAAAGAVV